MWARISATRPGDGSSRSVRIERSARRTLRYWTSSAWHRRHCSTCRREARGSTTDPSATSASWWLSSSHRTDVDLVDLGEELRPQAMPGPMEAHLRGGHGDPE